MNPLLPLYLTAVQEPVLPLRSATVAFSGTIVMTGALVLACARSRTPVPPVPVTFAVPDVLELVEPPLVDPPEKLLKKSRRTYPAMVPQRTGCQPSKWAGPRSVSVVPSRIVIRMGAL